jgi:acyl carrier protein
MNNVTHSGFEGIPARDDVIEAVIDIFVRVIGFIKRHEVSPTSHIVNDYYVDTDDLSIFAIEVGKHFGIKTPPGEWPSGFEPTIEGIADFILFHLSEKQ